MEGKSRVLKRKELRRRDGGKQVVEREAEGPALHNFQLLSFSLTHTTELSCCFRYNGSPETTKKYNEKV